MSNRIAVSCDYYSHSAELDNCYSENYLCKKAVKKFAGVTFKMLFFLKGGVNE